MKMVPRVGVGVGVCVTVIQTQANVEANHDGGGDNMRAHVM